MKICLWLLFGTLAASGGLSAQTVYSVPADSKGNQLTLTIANQSTKQAAQDVRIQTGKHSPAIQFSASIQSINKLEAMKGADVTFRFDVGRDVRVNAKDTIEFLVTDKLGSSWRKDIVLQFSGPTEFKLDQNFPNPFNPTTTIYFQLPVASKVTIRVYDLLGRVVTTLVEELREAGYQEVKFDATGLSSGTYFCRMAANPGRDKADFISVKKMLVMK